MKVLKFGGTSVSTHKNLQIASEIISKEEEQFIVVVSAFSGVTNLLVDAIEDALKKKESYKKKIDAIEEIHIKNIHQYVPISSQNKVISFLKIKLNELGDILEAVYVLGEKTNKTINKILSFGEMLSSNIIYEFFQAQKINISLVDAQNLIYTTFLENREVVNEKKTEIESHKFLDNISSKVILIPGFVATNELGETTTLGRGGSDYSAAIMASVMNASTLEIWTDVSGVYTANPVYVTKARPVEKISYLEAMELSHFGAKVIHFPNLYSLMEKKIPIYIKNTLSPDDKGTEIGFNDQDNPKEIVKSISYIEKIALLTLEGTMMQGMPGFSKKLFEILYQHNINVIMTTQASSESSICFAVEEAYATIAKKAIDKYFSYEIALKKIRPLNIEKGLSNITVVGDGMKNHQGISGKIFSVLGLNNINVVAITQGSSERNISFIINNHNIKKALNVLHEEFFEEGVRQLNLFIIGLGNVGGKLVDQIVQQKDYLKDKLGLKIRVRALANSRKMLFEKGEKIDLTQWREGIENADEKMDLEEFYKKIQQLNLRNSILIDNTANEAIANQYSRYLEKNVHVVASNKIACSGNYEIYKNLNYLSKKYGASFLFETNVGAGLPIIDTLNNLVDSGDEVLKIQAVLSGSLNFIFNTYLTGEKTFEEVVKLAMEEGYTEPDPKIDLSGIDVVRKILILARESGLELELNDVEIEDFLPKECLETKDNDSFFSALKKNESHFKKIIETANKNDSQIKYVAELVGDKAKTGLQYIEPTHTFYNLKGSDVIVLFYTKRYSQQPLIIKGAGAGADVTASGVFADIIKIGKK